jgi:hypothetical protein
LAAPRTPVAEQAAVGAEVAARAVTVSSLSLTKPATSAKSQCSALAFFSRLSHSIVDTHERFAF